MSVSGGPISGPEDGINRGHAIPGKSAVKDGCQRALVEAIERGTLGAGAVAEGEYLRNMHQAQVCTDETVR